MLACCSESDRYNNLHPHFSIFAQKESRQDSPRKQAHVTLLFEASVCVQIQADRDA